jgi:predicted aspartyl protease
MVAGMRAILLLLLLSACAGQSGECQLEALATLPVRLEGRVPVVTAEINGRPATLVIDTGSDATLLNEQAAQRLGVVGGGAVRDVRGAGGAASVRQGRIDSLALGPIRLQALRALLTQAPGPPYDGILGLDVLNAYELDLDVPQGRATLYRARPCATAAPGWTGPTVRLPTQMQANSGHLFVPVTIDGEPLRGMLDSGASVSALSIQAAEDLRINQQRLQRLPGGRGNAINAGGVQVRMRQFRSMQVGTDTLERPVLSIINLPPFAGDLLVGSDYLSTRRVWFSFLLGHVFVQGAPPQP